MAVNESRRNAIISGFVRTFGYRPTEQQIQEVSDYIDGLPRSERPNLQDISAGGISDRFTRGMAADAFLGTHFPQYQPENMGDDERQRLLGRSDIGPVVATAQERAASAAAGASAEEASGQEFLVDENGNYVRDQLGGYVLADQPDQAVYLNAQGEVVGSGPAWFGDEEEGPETIGGFPQEYFDNLGNAYDPEFLDRMRALDKPFATDYINVRDNVQRPDGTPLGKPQYYEWDQWQNFATKSPEYITQVQQALVDAGLLNSNDYRAGTWTFEAASAMTRAMAEANASGGRYTWTQVLKRRAESPELEDEDATGPRGPLAGRVLELPSFREPDYATLSQSVKDLFRNQLGREPVDWEVALLADQLNSDYRSAYDADVLASTTAFEAGNHAILATEDSDDPQISRPGSVPNVDPVARLRERFEKDYDASLDFAQDRVENRQNVANVFSALTQTTNALQGSLR